MLFVIFTGRERLYIHGTTANWKLEASHEGFTLPNRFDNQAMETHCAVHTASETGWQTENQCDAGDGERHCLGATEWLCLALAAP
jgi:hypothetical protein